METIGAFEAKNTLGRLLDRVERGEEIIVSRRGEPVARLVPADRTIDQGRAHQAVVSLRVLANELAAGEPVILQDLMAWRNAGRR
jgi:prevent-host-death family protein